MIGMLTRQRAKRVVAVEASCRSGRRKVFFFFLSKIYNNSRFARVILAKNIVLASKEM
jgi:hypothetical protein